MYIPSTAPGKTWEVCITNLSNRPKEAYAVEGVRSEYTFETIFPGSRMTPRFPIGKPATAKRKRAAMIQVLDHLMHNDLIQILCYLDAMKKIHDTLKEQDGGH